MFGVCRVTLSDNRDHSYIRALRDNVDQDKTQLVLVVIGGNKATYDAVKKFCCIEVPGECNCKGSKTKTDFLSVWSPGGPCTTRLM